MTAEKFIAYIRYEKRYSEHTINAYRKDLTQFSNYLHDQYNLNDIKQADHQIIRSWIIQLIETGINPRSVNRKLSALKSCFKYLQKNKQVETNPFNKIISPRSNKNLPHFIEESKIRKLFKQEDVADFNQFKELLIVDMLYSTGIRVSELIQLKIKDLDLENSQIKVSGKRNKERLIPFSNILRDHLNSYLSMKQRILDGPDVHTYLFTTIKGKKMYPRLVQNIVSRNLSQITTQKKISPHVLRHTFATHMLNNGADLNSIKELLGHSNLSATQVYTHTTIGQLKSIHKRSHPREKIKEE